MIKEEGLKRRYLVQNIWFAIFWLSMILIAAVLGLILYFILARGIKVINWEFLTAIPRRGMTEGGIFPRLWGLFIWY
jgi:phosphate transport system permease protein